MIMPRHAVCAGQGVHRNTSLHVLHIKAFIKEFCSSLCPRAPSDMGHDRGVTKHSSWHPARLSREPQPPCQNKKVANSDKLYVRTSGCIWQTASAVHTVAGHQRSETLKNLYPVAIASKQEKSSAKLATDYAECVQGPCTNMRAW